MRTRGPPPDWLERQLAYTRRGIQAIAGLIELDPADRAELPDGVLIRRDRDAAARLRRVRPRDPHADHHHFAGASIGITAAAYRDVGGLEPLAALEDAAFADRLASTGSRSCAPADVRVRTSARSRGRAPRGLSVDLDVSIWSERRRHWPPSSVPTSCPPQGRHDGGRRDPDQGLRRDDRRGPARRRPARRPRPGRRTRRGGRRLHRRHRRRWPPPPAPGPAAG